MVLDPIRGDSAPKCPRDMYSDINICVYMILGHGSTNLFNHPGPGSISSKNTTFFFFFLTSSFQLRDLLKWSVPRWPGEQRTKKQVYNLIYLVPKQIVAVARFPIHSEGGDLRTINTNFYLFGALYIVQ